MQMAGGALKSCKCKLGNRQEDGEEGMLTAHGRRKIKSDFQASALLALNSSEAIKRRNAKQTVAESNFRRVEEQFRHRITYYKKLCHINVLYRKL